MRSISRISLFAIPFALLCCVSLAVAEDSGEWTDLLEGNDLKKHWVTTGNWSIDDDGVVELKPRPGESGWSRHSAYLASEKKYENFQIKFDYKLAPKGNSGFYFHIGDNAEPVKTGIEVQIYDSGDKAQDAKLTDHDSGGIIPGIPPTKNTANKAGEWNSFDITVQDRQIVIKLNGEVVNKTKLGEGRLKDKPTTGTISFQDHGLPLWLRNIKIREL
ncbi:MAG: DUF1080 domain-containing protein [Pirellulaceae bacterium]